MAEIEDALSEGTSLLDTLLPLLSVPALVSLANLGEIAAVLSFRGSHFGIEFLFPVPVGDLWSFVNTPDIGGGVAISTYGFSGAISPPFLALLVALLYLVIYALLSAGYLGSIQQHRTEGRYDFLRNAMRYALRYLALTALLFGSVLLMIPFVLLAPPLVLLLILAVLLIGYLFWGAWFLIPVRDAGVIESLRWSYDLATGESDYLVWTLTHMVIGAVVSLLATFVVVNGGLVGILVGLVAVVPVGFVLTVASLHIIDDLTDSGPRGPTDGFETPTGQQQRQSTGWEY